MIKINGTSTASTLQSTESGFEVGTYGLSTEVGRQLFEPQRSNNFAFIVPSLAGIAPVASNDDDAAKAVIAHAPDYLRLSVVSANVPHFNQSVLSVRRGNSEMKFAGVPTFDSGSLVIKDYIGADGLSILMAWQNLSYNVRTEKVGHANDYKKDCYLIAYTPDYVQVRQWLLKGCWISKLSENDFSQENNELRNITATIEYDAAMIDTTDVEFETINN